MSLEVRRTVATRLFRNNKFSDEYYTPAAAWAEWVRDNNITKIYEPFAGDGSVEKEWKALGVKAVLDGRDFWEQTSAPDSDWVATNPPFSFKWLVLETLLERFQNNKNLAIILPWHSFYSNGLKRLTWFQNKYGGAWSRRSLSTAGSLFRTPDGGTKAIGCYILEVRW